MTHPCRASRDPLKGAMPADRETRTHGILAPNAHHVQTSLDKN